MKISLKKLENRDSVSQEEIDLCVEKALKNYGEERCCIHGEGGVAYITKIYSYGYSLELDLCCAQYGYDLCSEEIQQSFKEWEEFIEPNWKKYYKAETFKMSINLKLKAKPEKE